MWRTHVTTLLPHFTSSRWPSRVDCSHRHVGTHLLQPQCCVAMSQPKETQTDDLQHNSHWDYPFHSSIAATNSTLYAALLRRHMGSCYYQWQESGFKPDLVFLFVCITVCNIMFALNLNLENLKHFTCNWKRLKVTVWGPLL